MVRHIYGQPGWGNNRRRSECKEKRGNVYQDPNYGGIQNVLNSVAVIYQADSDMLPGEVVNPYHEAPVAA